MSKYSCPRNRNSPSTLPVPLGFECLRVFLDPSLYPLLRQNQEQKLTYTQAKKDMKVYFLYCWKKIWWTPLLSGLVFRCSGTYVLRGSPLMGPSSVAPAQRWGTPSQGPMATPPSSMPRPTARVAPPRPADSRASSQRRRALWPAAGRARSPSRWKRQGSERSAHPTRTDFTARPLRAPLSALCRDRATSEQGADGARSGGSRKGRTGAGIPSGVRLPERS